MTCERAGCRPAGRNGKSALASHSANRVRGSRRRHLTPSQQAPTNPNKPRQAPTSVNNGFDNALHSSRRSTRRTPFTRAGRRWPRAGRAPCPTLPRSSGILRDSALQASRPYAAHRPALRIRAQAETCPCVYILASAHNGTLYIGVTSDLLQRIALRKQDLIEGFIKRDPRWASRPFATHALSKRARGAVHESRPGPTRAPTGTRGAGMTARAACVRARQATGARPA